MKDAYKAEQCCGTPSKMTSVQLVPNAEVRMVPVLPAMAGADGVVGGYAGSGSVNPCEDSAPKYGETYKTAFNNKDCFNTEKNSPGF